MPARAGGILNARFVIGVAIIILGVILVLRNLGVELGFNILSLWPVILILIGAGHLNQPLETRQSMGGWILIILGIIFLLNSLDILDIAWRHIWPFILILIGLAILRHALWGSARSASDKDFINLSFVLGGGNFKFNSSNLKGGKLTAFMGGGKVDLREADMKSDEMILDTFALWGGIELFVPHHWQVNMRGTPILGGMDNNTSTSTGNTQD